jgi:RES domain-containing protein
MLQDDWQVFSDKVTVLENEKDLLDAIMSSGWEKDSGTDPIDVYGLFTRRDSFYRSSPFEKWQEFCEQVRQDPDSALPFSEFFTEELARLTETVAPSTMLYRSRRGYNIEEDSMVPYEAGEMTAPPVDLAAAGRANRKGKRVLYCSDEENTCISEVRPWHGAVISVCLIRPKKNLDIIDLTRAVEEPNPFIEESLRYELELAELLSGFGNELSTPLTRDEAEAEYFPSQRLSEFIEESGFRGMRYPSAMNPGGTNIVFFNPEDAEILDSKLVRVTKLVVEYEDG